MGSIRILLGSARWRRRRALPAEALSGVDPFGSPTFLYLTDTQRKRRLVERQFLQRRQQPVFAPPVRVLSELLDDLHARHGDGRGVLSTASQALLAERILTAGDWPWLQQMGAPSTVATALAHLHLALLEGPGPHWLPEALSAASVPGERRGELLAALAAHRDAIDALATRVCRPTAWAGLLPILEQPPPALLEWLRQVHSVVVDDILQPSPLRTALLIALARAWSAAGTHVVLSFETGRDLGGREASLFFGFSAEEGAREGLHSLKPFSATAALRRALFDELVATGEADIYVVGDQVRHVEPWTEPGPLGPRSLTDHLGGPPVPADELATLTEGLQFAACRDPQHEVDTLAAEVAAALAEGVPPRDCIIAVPELGPYGALLRRALSDRAVPFTVSAGRRLHESPLGVLVRRLMRLASQGLAAADVVALLRCDLVAPFDALDASGLERWCLANGVQQLDGLDRVAPIHDLLAPVRAAATPADHCEAWRQLLLALQVPDRLAHCPTAPRQTGDGLRAWGSLLRTLEQLERDLDAVDTGVWAADALRSALEAALRSASYQPGPRSDDQVQVVGLLELRGLTARYTWLAGLTRGHFPRRAAVPWLVPHSVQRQLEPVDALAEARYLLTSLLRNATDDPSITRVRLSWPLTREGRPAGAAPLLVDLLGLPLDDGRLLRDAVVVEPDDAVVARPVPPAPGPHGHLERPPWPPTALSVTAFETYLKCPARDWYQRVLGLHPEDAWSADLDPRRRGTVIHRILDRFLRERELRALHREPDVQGAARHLHTVAVDVLDELQTQGGFEPAIQAHQRSRWLAGLVDHHPAGLLRAWLDAEIDGALPLTPVASESSFSDLPVGPLTLRGTIDRVDALPDGALLITDYKTGLAPSTRAIRDGLALQPFAYAAAVSRDRPGAPVASVYWSLRRPDRLQRTGWTGDAELLDRLMPPRTRRFGTPLSDQPLEHAADAARALVAGHVPTTAARPEDVGCRHCPYRRICRSSEARDAA